MNDHVPVAKVPIAEVRAPRFAPTTLRAAWWAHRALRHARRDLKRNGIKACVPRPPRLPRAAGRGVKAVLRRQSPTCLERSLVLQAWLAAHDEPCDVVVGVAPRGATFDAHAWLDIETAIAPVDRYQELLRIPPR